MQMMRSLSYDLQLGTPASFDRILCLLEQSRNKPFRDAVQRFLRPTLLRCTDHLPSRRKAIADLGLCWISLSRMIIDLYVPDRFIDPAVVRSYAQEIWLQEEAAILSQIHLHSELERRSTGNDSNDIVTFFSAHLKEISENLASSPQLDLNRHNVSRLRTFWKEVSQFLSQVTSTSRIDSLLLSDHSDEAASSREDIIQQSIAGFCQRLDAVYPEYADIAFPLQLALLHMRLGLRLNLHSVVGDSDVTSNSVTRTCTALVAFPVVRSIDILLAKTGPSYPSSETAFRHLLLKLTAVGLEKSLGVDIEDRVHFVETAYDQIFRLWLIDRTREDDMDLVSQSLYRHKPLDYQAVSDAEVEEHEFLALFPDFEDVLQQDTQPQAEAKQQVTPLVSFPQILHLVNIHHHLFSTSLRASDSPSEILTIFNDIRISELGTILDSQMMLLSDVIDEESLSFQFSLLNNRLSELRCVQNVVGKSYDFYSDSNVLEVKKASTVVSTLRKRLATLIQEWPDQMVLQHLKNRCDLILDLDLHSPIAKILAAVEQLLMASEDWEIYANRENTLKEHQVIMTGLIVTVILALSVANTGEIFRERRYALVVPSLRYHDPRNPRRNEPRITRCRRLH
jgi:midasin